jgi:hypothetical protein
MAYTSTLNSRGMMTGGALLAASSNKLLTASATWADILAASIRTTRNVTLLRVYCVSSASQYGLYCHRVTADAATEIQRERLVSPSGGYTAYANQGSMFLLACTSGEYINFKIGDPYTPLGRNNAGKNRVASKLKKLIVEELPFE